MQKKLLDRLVRNRFNSRRSDVRNLLDTSKRSSRRRALPSYIKGVHNGVFFKIKVPPPKSLPALPKLPLPQGAVPKAFKRVEESSKSHQGGRGSSRWDWERVLAWWKENWPVLVLNFGSMCTLTGFTRSDVLELRSLSVTGSLSFVVYSLTQQPLRYTPIVWTMTFAAVNAFKIFQIMQERKGTVHLTEKEEAVYIQFFMPHGVTPKQFEAIYSHATTINIPQNQCLLKQGEKIQSVYLITHGSTRANILGRHLTAASTEPTAHESRMGGASGAWVGEMTFLESYWLKEQSKHLPAKANASASCNGAKADASSSDDAATKRRTSAVGSNGAVKVTARHATPYQPKTSHALYTIVAKEDCTVLRWDFEDMESLLERSTDLRSAMTRAMSAAIVGKVINFTVSRSAGRPTWSAWLDDWKYSAGAQIQVEDDAKQEFHLQEDDEDDNTSGDPQLEKLPKYPVKKLG